MNLVRTEETLFCSSKWWGDPDLPPQLEYPLFACEEDGEEYPLTFVCQINCEEIAPFDKEGLLPHEGMLYFFAAIDDFVGYESPESFPLGEWPKKAVAVKYAKQINFETFCSCILVDEENQPLTEPALKIEFSRDEDEAGYGHKLLGLPFFEEVREAMDGYVNLLQIDEDDDLGIRFYDSGMLNIMMKASDLKFGNWKRAVGYLHSL